MFNIRVPLTSGTRLTDKLVIDKLISDAGGTSLTYVAGMYSDKGVLERKVVIKEYYPYESTVKLVRKGNKIIPASEDTELVENTVSGITENFDKEYKTTAKLAVSGDSNSVFHFNVSDITEIVTKNKSFSGTLARYLSVDTKEGSSLSAIVEKYVDLPLKTSLSLIRKILIPLKIMHKKGMLHLDLKEDNLYFPACNMDQLGLQGTYCVILDCGSVKSVDNIDSDSYISFTKGYAAPEMMRIFNPGDPDEEILKEYRKLITPATDLYSVGMIAYRLIMGKDINIDDWNSIANEDDPEEKSSMISNSIKQKLGQEYPFVCERLCGILTKLLYTMPSIDPDYPDDFVRYEKIGNKEACEILDDELSTVIEILGNSGYHPEVLAQMSRDQYKIILQNNNIVEEEYHNIDISPFVKEWLADVECVL